MVTILNSVCTLAICAAGLSGVKAATQLVKGIMIQTMVNTVVPMMLNIRWMRVVRFASLFAPHGGQHGRDTVADILTKQNKYSAVDSNKPADSQGLQDSDGRGMRTG